MFTLAFDTSTLFETVAILDDAAVVDEVSFKVERTHSHSLMPCVHELLTRNSITLKDIQIIAVGVGPGSFTALRIGIATAKGLALAGNTPLVGVPTLLALAESLAETLKEASAPECYIVPLLDARRNEVYGQVFRYAPKTPASLRDVSFVGDRGEPEIWADAKTTDTYFALNPNIQWPGSRVAPVREPIMPVGAHPLSSFLIDYGELTWFCGDGCTVFQEKINHAKVKKVRFASSEHSKPRASIIGTLARYAFQAGFRPTVHQIRPLYFRQPDVRT